MGIKQESLKTLFTAFGMLDNTRNINKSGSGLGLFLCKNLCDLMGCRMEVDSILGKGTTFSIIFENIV